MKIKAFVLNITAFIPELEKTNLIPKRKQSNPMYKSLIYRYKMKEWVEEL